MVQTFDLLVIGSGSGGSGLANRAAQHGAKVAVIEGGQLAGTCVNVGCVPKKLSWYASRVHETISHLGPGYGFSCENLIFDYQQFLLNRDGYVSRSRASYANNFSKNQVTLIEGYGHFIDNHHVQVADEVYTASYIAIATGSRPIILDQIQGIELTDTSDDFFTWQDLPQSVAVIGGGYIATEFAGLLKGLGIEVHNIFLMDRVLENFDTMLSDQLMLEMQKQGIQLYPETQIDTFRKNGNQIECIQKGEVCCKVDRVIMAVGREPNIDKLGLDKTDVQLQADKTIVVDDQHQTSVPHIYALGDVIGKVNLTPVAIRAGRQIAEHLFNQAESAAISYENVPTVVFSHPAIGTIGLSEAQAIKQYGAERIKVYTNQFYAMYVSGGGQRQPCHFKLVCLDQEEKVIGLHGIGEGVDEMIQGFGVAIKMGATKADFDAVVAIHPTGSEEFVTMR